MRHQYSTTSGSWDHVERGGGLICVRYIRYAGLKTVQSYFTVN